MLKVVEEPALTVAGNDGDCKVAVTRFVDEVPRYTVVIFALLVPVFLMTMLILLLRGQDTFS